MLALILSLACETPPVDSGEKAPEIPSDYDPELDTAAQIAPDLGALTEDANAMLTEIRGINAAPLPAIFETAMSWGDDNCPYYMMETETETYTSSTCTTIDGTSYYGDAFYSTLVGVDGYGMSYLRRELFSHMRIGRSDGLSLHTAGSAILQESATEDGGADFISQVMGLFVASDTLAGGDWMTEGIENNLELHFKANAIGVPQFATITGSVGGLGTTYGDGSFPAFKLGTVESGWQCTGEPYGSLAMRAADGHWLTIAFDTPDEFGSLPSDPSLCDGCGTVSDGDGVVGEVCLDFSPLFDWEDRPW